MNHPLSVGIIHLRVPLKQPELSSSQLRLTQFKRSSNCNLNKKSIDKKQYFALRYNEDFLEDALLNFAEKTSENVLV